MRRTAQSTEQVAATLQGLVRLRLAAGVNQTALAARLGITQSEVSKFERGERALDEQRLQAWLLALGVDSLSTVAPVGSAEARPEWADWRRSVGGSSPPKSGSYSPSERSTNWSVSID